MMILRVKLVHPAAKLPARMTPGSAGLDLYAAESIEVPPTRCEQDGCVEVGRALVPIGIKLQLPPGTVGRIASRSGLSVNSNIEAGAGWIDNDYRGELKVELKNFSSKPYKVNPGDRIAQLVILPLADVEVKSVLHLEDTERGSSGFGSTNSRYGK
jgi:dUTP diphosphatase